MARISCFVALAIMTLLSITTLTTALAIPVFHHHPMPEAHPHTFHRNMTLPAMIRGVNVGNWLILEKWMDPGLWDGANATDQWTFDSAPGARKKLKEHWETWFTEKDVKKIASWGINALRIPIGFWAFDNQGTPYIKGADEYLGRAIGWARKYGLKVLIDCHGSPGSQNGWDNSGHKGEVQWQQDGNLERSISVLQTMARKYGSNKYADVVMGIQLVNEPIYWGDNNSNVTEAWAAEAYKAVREAASNKNLLVVMSDGFRSPSDWTDVAESINGNATTSEAKFVIDTHLYQNQMQVDSELDQEQHIEKACDWTQTDLLPTDSNVPVFIGEFSGWTDICAYPNGTTTAGNTCNVDTCQCLSNTEIRFWNPPLVQATRKFLEAEIEAFEHSTRGWFIWSYKAPGVWGMENIMQYGLLGKTVTDRMFPNQCGFGAGGGGEVEDG